MRIGEHHIAGRGAGAIERPEGLLQRARPVHIEQAQIHSRRIEGGPMNRNGTPPPAVLEQSDPTRCA